MKLSTKIDVKSDMLSLHSTVQEILRALYFYGVDYLMVVIGDRERLLHKDQLVALLEQGREKATLEDTLSVTLTEPLASRMQMEDIPQGVSLLLFSNDELLSTTFEIYREQKITAMMVILPDWWSVPMPLLHMKDDTISLNESALLLIPGGAASLSANAEKLREERLIVLKEKKRERTLSLAPLTDETFLLEDISGDFEMAEDLVWWAAIGRAFVRRMEENNLSVLRLSPYEIEPETVAEIIPCSWEGELMGKLAILLPEEQPNSEEDQVVVKKTAATKGTAKDKNIGTADLTAIDQSADRVKPSARKAPTKRGLNPQTAPVEAVKLKSAASRGKKKA